MILHTVHVSPAHPAFTECVRIAGAADAVLLLADGVYAALADTPGSSALQACGCRLYILDADAACAAVRPQDSFTLVDMDGFVELSEQYPRQQAWY